MNPAIEFKENTKKKLIAGVIAIALILLSFVLKQYGASFGISVVQARSFSLVPQLVSLGFILWAVYLNKCPSCKKQAGTGWSIKECKNCGISLQSNT